MSKKPSGANVEVVLCQQHDMSCEQGSHTLEISIFLTISQLFMPNHFPTKAMWSHDFSDAKFPMFLFFFFKMFKYFAE